MGSHKRIHSFLVLTHHVDFRVQLGIIHKVHHPTINSLNQTSELRGSLVLLGRGSTGFDT